MPTDTRVAAVLAAALLISCQRSDVASSGDTTPARTMAESPGALATRHEAQESLDRARLAFERKDLALSRSELADAAGFLRTEALEAEGAASEALTRAAGELDALGADIAQGRVRSATALTRASLTVNRAEATYHLLRARDAIAKRDHVRAGEELTMSVDHLERAASDGGRKTDAVVGNAVADARTLAGEMMKGTAAATDEVTRVSDEIAAAISRLGTGVAVTKE